MPILFIEHKSLVTQSNSIIELNPLVINEISYRPLNFEYFNNVVLKLA